MTKPITASSLTNDPTAFAAWAVSIRSNKMTPEEAISYLSGEGIFIRPKGEQRKARKGSLAVGEVVKVEGSKCTHPKNTKNCGVLSFNPDNPIYCVITDINRPEDIKQPCTIEVAPISLSTGKPGNKFKFVAVEPVRISGIQKKIQSSQKRMQKFLDKGEETKAKMEEDKIDLLLREVREKSLSPHDGVGLYRAFKNIGSYLSSNAPKTSFAVVYDRGGKAKAPQARKDLTSRMLAERKKNTSLHGNFSDLMEGSMSEYAIMYYEGVIVSAGYNKEGQFYFLMEEKNGRGYTSISPNVGKLYFVSSAPDMPSQKAWQDQFRAKMEDIAEEEVDS